MGHKVLFITFWYPTPGNPSRGIFIQEHANALIHAGNQLRIIHFDISYGKSLLTVRRHQLKMSNPEPIYRMEIHSRFWKLLYHLYPLLNLMALRASKKLIREGFRPQVIHSNVIFPSGVVGYFLGRKLRVPVVLSEHWSGFQRFYNHPLLGRITRKAAAHFSMIMPVSNFLGQMIGKCTGKPAQIRVVPNVIDSSIFTLKPPIPERPELKLLMCANWQRGKKRIKRPDLVVNALKIFAEKSQKRIILRIVGEGDLLDEIKYESPRLGFACEFLGNRKKKEINQLLHDTDFFLHASEFETFSVVAAEAIMTGTPVIVSDLPALKEFVNPGNGVLVENSPEAWYEALTKATTQQWDRKQIALSLQDKYSYTTIGQQLNEAYNELNINY